MSEEVSDVVGVSVRGVPRMTFPICTGSPRALLSSPWLVVVGAPKGWCPCAGARGLGTGTLLCSAQTVFLHARLGECLHDLFEIQIHAWTQQSRLKKAARNQASTVKKKGKQKQGSLSVPAWHWSLSCVPSCS